MKRLLAIILLLCTLCLSSCGVLKELNAGMDEAIILVEDFCSALADDDIESAKRFLHPNSTPKQDELSAFITKLEQTHNIDFSGGVTFKHSTDTRSTYYDSNYDGSVHEINYEIVVGGVNVEFFFVIVKNDNGYGIYSFGVEK